MIPWLLTLVLGTGASSLVGAWAVKARVARPTTAEATQWAIAFFLAVVPFLKSVGPYAWFMIPTILVNPALNWSLLAVYLLAVPIRSIYYLAHADAAIEDFSQGALDLGVEFTRWVDTGGGGWKLRNVEATLGLRQPPVFRAANINSPITRGVFAPLVLLPLAWIPQEALSPRGQELRTNLGIEGHVNPEGVFAAILHELSHHQSRDPQRALLRLIVAMILPFEWTLADVDNDRFAQVDLGVLGRGIHATFALTRWPVQRVVQAAWSFQEARADEGAFRFDDHAKERLDALRGGEASWSGAHPKTLGSMPASWACVFVMVGLGLLAAYLAPGRPMMGLAMGGDGGIVGLQPRGWSINTLENKFGNRPVLLYRPPTRAHPCQVEYRAGLDDGPLDPGQDSPQGVMFYCRAYAEEPIVGPVRYRITWAFWRKAPPVNIPIFPVFLFLRPVESAAVSDDPRTLSYLSSNPADFLLADLGGGRFQATWTVEVPLGRRADYFSIEWRAILPGKVIFDPPTVEKMP